MTPNTLCDVLIVGGGPAGMMAAIAAAQSGARVILCEQLDRPGVKLLATGGGRCNLTNLVPAEEFMAAFGRQGRFIQPALAAMDNEALCEFFVALGVPLQCEDGLHVFPASNRAADVLAALRRRCEELGVEIRTDSRVEELLVDSATSPRVTGVKTSKGDILANGVIIACGGRTYPELGATGDGYVLAKQVGHEIVAPMPAITPLLTVETWPAQCAGVSIEARISIDLQRLTAGSRSSWQGDVLFTHTGLSGPAALNISGSVAQFLGTRKEVPIRLDLQPGTTRQAWLDRIRDWGLSWGNKSISTLLAAKLPMSVAQCICGLIGLDGATRAAEVPRVQREALASAMSALPLTVRAVGGFDQAMVTRGGMSLKQVDPRTLASKLVSGLYFAGEVLDLDGPCGGYNLHWAFASGHLAGLSTVRS